ncbi:surface-adhesin E family protein [Pseudomonas aeruginosa]|nr:MULTISPECIES: surface-adhesin E family protein [Pseudomonas]MDG0900186.1 hypothetical protein [Pseudomonas sp. L01]HCL2909891.1 hypothetical protein [Pseudomonas aeruginosa 059A]EIU1656292.1 hypothetical protein [Pseudomonas aeruginosa]EIU3466393.1 hypothetical protein [Pseudomonas aeruginosa]EIU7136979.1 hypothetical protein [Pseudomonas aeruginosa]
MTVTRTFIIVFAVVLSVTAMSADTPKSAQDFQASDTWHEVFKGANDQTVSTKGAVRTETGRYEVWFKIDSPLPPICRCNVFARSPADSVICKSEKRSKTESSVSYYEINCARGTSRITQSIDCNFEGEVITQLDHESGKWTRPFPDSVGEGLNKLFCKRGN